MRLLLLFTLAISLIQSVNAQNTDQEKARTAFLEAEKQYQSGNYADCLTTLQTVKQLLGRTNARVQYLMVKALVGQQDWAKAQPELDRYLTLNDSSTERIAEMQQMAQTITDRLATGQAVDSPATTPQPNPAVATQPAGSASAVATPVVAPPQATKAPVLATQPSTLRPPRQIGLKLLTAAIGTGAGAYALALNSQFTTKKNALTEAARTADPDNNRIITDRAEFTRWTTAYSEAQDAQNRNGLFRVCIGIAAVAALTETYLLMHKPKGPRRHVSVKPASTAWGLALHYNL